MARQIQSSPGTKKISEIYRRIKESSLILQPEFQRKYVWTSEHKEEFIDTILKGLPFPEIYIAQKGIDIDTIITSEVIVDGQQRLSTIMQYIDEPTGSREFGRLVTKFKDLNEQDRNDLLNYNVVFRDLGDLDSQTVKEIFRRINLTKFGLEQIEIQHAVYDGEFISCAKSILENIDDDHFQIFSESELTRMADLHYVLLLQATIISEGYFSRDKEIEKLIIELNDDFPQRREIEEGFITHFKFIDKLGLENDSIWLRKSNFFTMFIETYPLSPKPDSESLKQKLQQFEENILANRQHARDHNDFSLYYSNMYTGTNNRTSRVTRGDLFKKYVIDEG